MSGWKGSNRRERLPDNWHITQPRILIRDRHQCQHKRSDTGRLCRALARQVDHIVAGDDDRDVNLQALCDYHHAKKSGQEGGLASGVSRRATAAKKKPKHPGLLDVAREPAPLPQRQTDYDVEPYPF